MIGLLCTADGIPIAHHVFAGNTADVSTLPGVLADLQDRFGVGRICVVADRGLISADNVDVVAGHGFDHLIATRLHRDPTCAEALTSSTRPTPAGCPCPRPTAPPATSPWPTAAGPWWSPAPNATTATRCAPPSSSPAPRRSCSPSKTVSAPARLVDAGKIGRAAQRILGPSGVGHLFDVEIAEGRFVYHYNDAAFDYEELLAGRYVLVTSLSRRPGHHRRRRRRLPPAATVEHRFRVLKDFLHLRPVRHWTERRVHGHIAICVYAAVIEALITAALAAADVRDPDLARPAPLRRPRPTRTRPRPHRHPRRRRPPRRRHHPPQPAPGTHPRRPRRRHRQLGPRPHHLSRQAHHTPM